MFTVKILQGALCKVCILFDQNLESNPRGLFIKTVFQDISKSENLVRPETKEYHEDALKRANDFLGSYDDYTLNQ